MYNSAKQSSTHAPSYSTTLTIDTITNLLSLKADVHFTMPPRAGGRADLLAYSSISYELTVAEGGWL